MPIHSTRTTVVIEDFSVETFVGHQDQEMNQPQIVLVGIVCTLHNPDVLNDNLENSFDYVPVVEKVRELALHRKRKLIETFAEEIAEECFTNPRVKTVTVSVRKPNKLPAVKAVGTERTFERS